ncbi:MAG: hypothetical protein Q9169_008399 [Polycauliona sp. 2 TL-2023]
MAGARPGDAERLITSERPRLGSGVHRKPRFLVIGAGQRGTAYSAAVAREGLAAIIAAIADPIRSKRFSLGRKYIWKDETPREDQEFDSWHHFLEYEKSRREAEAAGEKVYAGVDGIILCTQDQMHQQILHAFAPLKLHVLCEKPIATTLQDCQDIYHSLGANNPSQIFSTGHVLRYSPHNMLLRKLLLQDRVIGELISIEHTEPVGWFHFSHSYVRGNWRKESIAAPSLLCKSCHDIDFILWLLCYKTDLGEPAHMPSLVSSTGNLSLFTKRRKPKAAGNATNCFSCHHERNCNWSAKKMYIERLYDKGHRDFPVCVVVPDIEDIIAKNGTESGRTILTQRLSEDYDASTTPKADIESKQWYGRCVWESDNDVLDDQIVTLSWDDDSPTMNGKEFPDRGPKTALFHMIAHTEAQCERRGTISGTHGEIHYDSHEIRVYTFDKFMQPSSVQVHTPPKAAGGHGGGDGGLMNGFARAVEAVVNGELGVEEAQARYVGCTLKEAFMSHAMVFAAEEARLGKKVVEWRDWWAELDGRAATG